MKLSVKLILVFVLLALIPMMLIGYIAYENGRQSILKNTFHHLSHVNTLKAAEYSRWIDNNKQSLRELARRPLIREYAASLSLQYRTEPEYKITQRLILDDHLFPILEEEGGFLDLFILRMDDGKVLVSTHEEQEGQHKENRPYFIAGKDRTYVQDVYYCLDMEAPTIVIATPVNDNEGNLIAVLAGHVNLGEMTRIMMAGNLPDHGEESYLVNRFNFFITEPMFGEEYILKKSIHTEGVEAGLAYNNGVRLYDNYRGIPVIGAYQWLPEFETVIITEVDQATAFVSINSLRNMVFGIAVLVGLIVVLIGFAFSRSVTRRLRYLVEGSTVIGRGHLEYRLDSKGKDEIDDLANALNNMAGSLGEITASRDELNKEIEIRKQAEEEFENIFNLSSDMVGVFTTEGGLIRVNPSWETILGYKTEELLEMGWATLVHPDDVERTNKEVEEQLKGSPVVDFINRYKCKDGSYKTLEWRATFAKEGIVYATARDITERKRTEEAIKQAAEEWRETFDSITDSVFICDNDYKLLRVNKAFADAFKMKPKELIGKRCYEIVHGTNEPIPNCPHQQTINTKEPVILEYFEPHLGLYLEVVASPLFNEKGEVIACVHIARDITERKQAEEQLLLVENAVKASVSGVSITDLSGKLTYVNPALVDMFGYDNPEEMLGKNVISLAKEMGKAQSVMKTMLASGANTVMELVGEKKDGTEIIVELMASIITDVRGQPVGMVASLLDITERRQMEEERTKYAKLESVGTLAGGIAHDFNNILTGIMGNIGLAMRAVGIGEKDRATQRLEEAEKASIRARDLTQQLLTFSRGGAPIKKMVSITRLLKEAAGFALRGSNVRCDFNLPDDLWLVEIDEGQINQVIANLVINADQAMPEGGVLNLGARNTVIKRKGASPLPKGNYVEITIEDHGIGISKEHLGRIFDPYFTTKQKGSGLGLATAYSIINKHDGHITVKSQRDAGTTFSIYLPASRKKQVSAKKEAIKEAPVRGEGKILVMDDEATIREMLSKMLSLAGYEVTLTEDGAETIARYTKAKESGQPFDAVIMDLTIPGGMGGKEAIKKLLEIDPQAKVIVSSGYATDPMMADFKGYGFSAVATKPYSVAQIEKVLQSLLRKKR